MRLAICTLRQLIKTSNRESCCRGTVDMTLTCKENDIGRRTS